MSLDIAKHSNKLLFVPFGGAAEIGMNLNAYHYNGKWIIVDMGIGFADGHYPGVDIVLPLPDFLEEYKDDVEALLVTHAHEDHIGAVPYIWSAIGCPIYTTGFNKILLESKLSEFKHDENVEIIDVVANDKITLSEFAFEFIPITHSIPDMHGIMIYSGGGNIFHTGDWKIDPNPVVGEVTDKEALERVSAEGVLALVGDSTNIFNEGESGSEGDLSKNLANIISSEKENLVIVTTFSSNIARIHSIAKAAADNNRKVVLVGRSLWRLYNAAKQYGYMDGIDEFLPADSFNKFDRKEVLVICSGCQGEELAATSKIVQSAHQYISVAKGDMIIFSSKVIPGNERRIFDLFNKFHKLGVKVVHEQNNFVHVSGHPARNEIKELYSIIKPKIVIPVHGEAMHLYEHCNFAKSIGIPHTVEVTNGNVIHISDDGASVIGTLPSGYLAFDGNSIIDISSNILRDRRSMMKDGIAVVILIFNRKQRLIRQPKILLPGVIDKREDVELLDLIVEEVSDFLSSDKVSKNEDKVRTGVIKLVKKLLQTHRNKYPHIIVHSERISV